MIYLRSVLDFARDAFGAFVGSQPVHVPKRRRGVAPVTTENGYVGRHARVTS